MMRTWWKRVNNRQQLVVAAVCILSIGGLAVLLFLLQPRSPALDIAEDTAALYRTVSRLEESLGTNEPAGTVTRRYLDSLEAIMAHCERIDRNFDEATEQELTTTLKNSLRSTEELCDDAANLAGDSAATYRTLQPLLETGSKLKRYQTLPFIQERVRAGHERDIAAAIAHFGKTPPSQDDDVYPSGVPGYLSDLNRTVASTGRLEYLPALARFQNRTLAERQHFWTNYASIATLRRELTAQLERYCDQLELSDSHPVCKAAHENSR